MTGRRWRLSGVLAVAALAFAVLAVAGTGELATPPAGSWASFDAWYQATGPATAAVVALRGFAMLGCGWLIVAASMQLLASLSLRHGLHRAADAVSPVVLQRVGRGVATLSVTAGLAVPPTPVTPRDDPPGTAVMEVVEEPAATSTTPPPAAPATPVPAPAAVAVDEIVVTAGDSFWSVAVDVLRDADGAHPGDREVVAYWQRLIDANRGRLVDPANPDLIFAGQRLTLPTP